MDDGHPQCSSFIKTLMYVCIHSDTGITEDPECTWAAIFLWLCAFTGRRSCFQRTLISNCSLKGICKVLDFPVLFSVLMKCWIFPMNLCCREHSNPFIFYKLPDVHQLFHTHFYHDSIYRFLFRMKGQVWIQSKHILYTAGLCHIIMCFD